MTGPEAVPTRPDEQAVAEALAEMRQHPQWVEKLGDVSKVIVRAALATGPDEPWAALREIAAYGCDRFTEPGDPTCRDSVERAAWCGCCVARAALAGARPAAEPAEGPPCSEIPGCDGECCQRATRPAAEPGLMDAWRSATDETGGA